jgi:AcrR family transcriptional regulator
MNPATVLDRSRRAEAAKAARREEILAAARRVFAARGFRGTTMADIAEEADIALGTIYLYFRSKEDVFAALNQLFGGIIAEAATRLPAGSTDARVRTSVGRVFAACEENRDLVRLVVLNSDPESEALKRIREGDETRGRPLVAWLSGGMKEGGIRSGDPAVMSRLIQGLVSISVYQAFVLSDGSDARKIRDACADMIISYLRPPAGEEGAIRAGEGDGSHGNG